MLAQKQSSDGGGPVRGFFPPPPSSRLLSDLHTSREGERAHFLVVCRDSAGERMTRGGEHVVVSIVHKGKKDW